MSLVIASAVIVAILEVHSVAHIMSKQVITTERIPIKLWLNSMEGDALRQAKNLANLPFAFHHIAIMPDAHVGFGMPIGGVLATIDVVVPNAVGRDIGCGICAARTNINHIELDQLKEIMKCIRQEVPVGFKHHIVAQDKKWMPEGHDLEELPICKQEYQSALKQIGTLGGGNHFMEIQKGDDGKIWIMVHSGSRNIGSKVADFYDKEAQRLNRLWYSKIEPSQQLAFLPMGTEIAKQYIKEMQYCVEFAFCNRRLMIQRIKGCIERVLHQDISFDNFINIAHNYAHVETHYGKEVIVHRKGATSAREGEKGIIPGSQGTNSYIVLGLGNNESFHSCSHGAGRIMGRKEAQRSLDLKEEIRKLEEKGVLHAIRGKYDLDEATGAYKPIDEVMENQKDLVNILVELEPLAVVKG